MSSSPSNRHSSSKYHRSSADTNTIPSPDPTSDPENKKYDEKSSSANESKITRSSSRHSSSKYNRSSANTNKISSPGSVSDPENKKYNEKKGSTDVSKITRSSSRHSSVKYNKSFANTNKIPPPDLISDPENIKQNEKSGSTDESKTTRSSRRHSAVKYHRSSANINRSPPSDSALDPENKKYNEKSGSANESKIIRSSSRHSSVKYRRSSANTNKISSPDSTPDPENIKYEKSGKTDESKTKRSSSRHSSSKSYRTSADTNTISSSDPTSDPENIKHNEKSGSTDESKTTRSSRHSLSKYHKSSANTNKISSPIPTSDPENKIYNEKSSNKDKSKTSRLSIRHSPSKSCRLSADTNTIPSPDPTSDPENIKHNEKSGNTGESKTTRSSSGHSPSKYRRSSANTNKISSPIPTSDPENKKHEKSGSTNESKTTRSSSRHSPSKSCRSSANTDTIPSPNPTSDPDNKKHNGKIVGADESKTTKLSRLHTPSKNSKYSVRSSLITTPDSENRKLIKKSGIADESKTTPHMSFRSSTHQTTRRSSKAFVTGKESPMNTPLIPSTTKSLFVEDKSLSSLSPDGGKKHRNKVGVKDADNIKKLTRSTRLTACQTPSNSSESSSEKNVCVNKSNSNLSDTKKSHNESDLDSISTRRNSYPQRRRVRSPESRSPQSHTNRSLSPIAKSVVINGHKKRLRSGGDSAFSLARSEDVKSPMLQKNDTSSTKLHEDAPSASPISSAPPNSSALSKRTTPSKNSAPSKSSTPSKNSALSKNSVPSTSSAPLKSSTLSKNSTLSENSVPLMSFAPSKISTPSRSSTSSISSSSMSQERVGMKRKLTSTLETLAKPVAVAIPDSEEVLPKCNLVPKCKQKHLVEYQDKQKCSVCKKVGAGIKFQCGIERHTLCLAHAEKYRGINSSFFNEQFDLEIRATCSLCAFYCRCDECKSHGKTNFTTMRKVCHHCHYTEDCYNFCGIKGHYYCQKSWLLPKFSTGCPICSGRCTCSACRKKEESNNEKLKEKNAQGESNNEKLKEKNTQKAQNVLKNKTIIKEDKRKEEKNLRRRSTGQYNLPIKPFLFKVCHICRNRRITYDLDCTNEDHYMCRDCVRDHDIDISSGICPACIKSCPCEKCVLRRSKLNFKSFHKNKSPKCVEARLSNKSTRKSVPLRLAAKLMCHVCDEKGRSVRFCCKGPRCHAHNLCSKHLKKLTGLDLAKVKDGDQHTCPVCTGLCKCYKCANDKESESSEEETLTSQETKVGDDESGTESEICEVSQILGWRKITKKTKMLNPNLSGRTLYEYKVRWKGFDSKHDSWEPGGNMKTEMAKQKAKRIRTTTHALRF